MVLSPYQTDSHCVLTTLLIYYAQLVMPFFEDIKRDQMLARYNMGTELFRPVRLLYKDVDSQPISYKVCNVVGAVQVWL